MVWALILFFALASPQVAFAEPSVAPDESIPEESVEDVPPEQSSETDYESDLPVEVTVTTEDVTLYDADGLVVSTPDEPVAASEGRALVNDVYGSVLPGSSWAEFALACMPKVPFTSDYVFYRAGQNEYLLCYGDIKFSNGTFTGSGVNYIRWYYQSGYSQYQQQSGTGTLDLDVGSYVVLSSLGDYPTLSGQDVNVTSLLCFIACVAAGVLILSRMLSFSLRTRVAVVDDGPSR